jgi:hypothetical protein
LRSGQEEGKISDIVRDTVDFQKQVVALYFSFFIYLLSDPYLREFDFLNLWLLDCTRLVFWDPGTVLAGKPAAIQLLP